MTPRPPIALLLLATACQPKTVLAPSEGLTRRPDTMQRALQRSAAVDEVCAALAAARQAQGSAFEQGWLPPPSHFTPEQASIWEAVRSVPARRRGWAFRAAAAEHLGPRVPCPALAYSPADCVTSTPVPRKVEAGPSGDAAPTAARQEYREVIRRAMTERLQSFRRCHDRWLSEGGRGDMKAVLHFRLTLDGDPTDAWVELSRDESSEFRQCILHALCTVDVERPPEWVSVVHYPLVFLDRRQSPGQPRTGAGAETLDER